MDFRFTDAIFGVPDDTGYDENLCHLDSSSFCSSPSRDLHLDFYSSDSSSQQFTNHCTPNSLHQPHPSTSTNSTGPFSVQSRIPLPGLAPLSRYHLWLETSFMCRRNERERQRVRNVNDGFSRLRNHLPRSPAMKRRQSKVETLQHAIRYIRHLQSLLEETKGDGERKDC